MFSFWVPRLLTRHANTSEPPRTQWPGVSRGLVGHTHGPILGTLVFEDIMIAVYLALLSAVALGEGTVFDAALAIGSAFAFLGGITLIAWYGSAYVERAFSVDSDELFLLRVLGVMTLLLGSRSRSG